MYQVRWGADYLMKMVGSGTGVNASYLEIIYQVCMLTVPQQCLQLLCMDVGYCAASVSGLMESAAGGCALAVTPVLQLDDSCYGPPAADQPPHPHLRVFPCCALSPVLFP